MPPVYRFAPSPTGLIHIGNARTALWNALLARQRGGTFILRFDDTDRERSRAEYAEAICADLAWLGIAPDRIERQSARVARYAEVLASLRAAGRVYPAYETAEELERKRRRQQARGQPPVYDRAALALSESARAALEAEGRRPHWRFRLSGLTVRWQDRVRGECHIETGALSDPVLVREDGTVLYTFASVVDDIDMGVTDILRGEDHVANTAVQIELFAALGAAPPRFAHHNLIAAADGSEMSKRTGALSLQSFRETGADPLAVAIVATLTGTSEPVRPLAGLDALAELLDEAKFSRALTKFDPAEIRDLSARLLHARPFTDLAGDLAALGIAGPLAEPFWAAIHGNVTRLAEAREWWEILTGNQHFGAGDEDTDFLAAAADCLPEAPFDSGTWPAWTQALQARTGRKGRALFMPLRLALTGREHGPELRAVLPLLGRSRVLSRLAPAPRS
ncbi:glutamate--tRNA ligase [Rhabdaerophilum calidifontis]|uniref:glutamate--tRNA ligase n=1 Tax=Rhabdaerophilum calidifontis TaxID=2604328 RepID=UPI00123A78C3|nr:glutamate--tRNA ligase [Rhabdaerophilum calidifontis]